MAEISLEYWRLEKCESLKWEDNPRNNRHDIGTLCSSIERHGFRDPCEFDDTLEAFTAGHGRIEACRGLQLRGKNKQSKQWPPKYIQADLDGEWKIPVLVGAAADSRNDAIAYLIDNNNIGMLGGDFTPWDLSKLYDQERYAELLVNLRDNDSLPESTDEDGLQYLLERMAREAAGDESDPDEAEDTTKASPLEYIIEFDNGDQKQTFLDFLDYLRNSYGEADSHAARLVKHIQGVIE